MPRAARTPWLGKEANQDAWYIYWFEDSRRVRRRSTRTCDRLEAEKALGQFLLEHADEETPRPIEPPDKHLIATVLCWYLQEHGPELATCELTARSVENLVEFFGPDATVSSITPQVLKRYGRQRIRKSRTYQTKNGEKVVINEKPISTGTIRRELVVLSAAINHAIENGRLTSAPKIVLPPMGQNKTRYLEPAEIEKLIACAPEPHTRLFIQLAINTGARKGALLDLTWKQVDFANRIIYLNPEDRIQTNKRRAIVPMNKLLYGVLQETKAKQELAAKKLSEETGKRVEACACVIDYNNLPVKNIRTGFRRSCERAGIKGVTPHTLRHTAGTLMALAGVDLFLIAKVLGHSVQKTTELYAHFRPDYLRGAVDVLAQATCARAPTQTQPSPELYH